MKNKKIKFFLISVVIMSSVLIVYFAFIFNFNSQLKITTFSDLKIYQFKVGTGHIEYTPSASQKKAIWNLINTMSPTEEINLKKEAKAGRYGAFVFKGKNIDTDFLLIDLDKDKLYISVVKYDKKGNVVNAERFISGTHVAKKIDNVILNYDYD